MIRPDRKNPASKPLVARRLPAAPPGHLERERISVEKQPHIADPGKNRPAAPRDKRSAVKGQAGSAPRPLTERRIRNIAEHYVASRECSQEMLRAVLLRRQMLRGREISCDTAQSEMEAALPLIEAEIARLVSAGLVDDARFAEARARTGLLRGRGMRKVLSDLAAKGVEKSVAADALREASREVTGTLGRPEVDDVEVARTAEWEAAETYARKKRFGPYRTCAAPSDTGQSARLWRKEASSMARQGFGLDVIRHIIDRDPCEDEF